MVELAMFNVQRVIIPKVGKPELWFMCSARPLMVLYICVKVRKNNSNGIKVTEWTQNYEALTNGRNDGHSKFRTVKHNTSPLFVVWHKKAHTHIQRKKKNNTKSI